MQIFDGAWANLITAAHLSLRKYNIILQAKPKKEGTSSHMS